MILPYVLRSRTIGWGDSSWLTPSENLETVWKVGNCLALLVEGLQVRISPHPASTGLFQLESRRQHLTAGCISLMMALTVCEFAGPFITSSGEMPTQTLCSGGIWMSYCVLRGFLYILATIALTSDLYLFLFFGASSLLCIVF